MMDDSLVVPVVGEDDDQHDDVDTDVGGSATTTVGTTSNNDDFIDVCPTKTTTTTTSTSPNDDGIFFDYRQTPLNACSLETMGCSVPIRKRRRRRQVQDVINGNNDVDDVVEQYVIPMCLGCYQLDETTGRREGWLDLYAVPVVLLASSSSSSASAMVPIHPTLDPTGDFDSSGNRRYIIESFGSSNSHPLNILGGKKKNNIIDNSGVELLSSGVLDGKWYPQQHAGRNTLIVPPPQSQQEHLYNHPMFQGYYASAHASGEILIHKISSNPQFGTNNNDDDACNDSSSCCHNNTNLHFPFQATLVGQSASPSANEGLCLSLAWDQQPVSSSSTLHIDVPSIIDTRIISSYSDGHVAIHRIQSAVSNNSSVGYDDNDNDDDDKLVLRLERHWEAHRMFNCPAEVWCVNFIPPFHHSGGGGATTTTTTTTIPYSHDLVVTGGDEGNWKVWDLQTTTTSTTTTGTTTRLVYSGKDDFDAGVTVLSPHPRLKHVLAIGSYDETIALFDLRTMMIVGSTEQQRRYGTPTKVFHSNPLGGGIWRCKWHPHDDNRLLVAAMHGGCFVLELNNLNDDFLASTTMIRSTNDEADVGHGYGLMSPPEITVTIQQHFTKHQSMAYGADWLIHRLDEKDDESDNENGIPSMGRIVEAAGSCSFYDRAMYLWKTK